MPQILSKNDRVLALIAVMAVASFVVGGVVHAVTYNDAAEIEATSARVAQLDALANRLSEDFDHQEAALGDYVLSQSPIALKGFNDAVAEKAAAA
jgi:hypothetical protein